MENISYTPLLFTFPSEAALIYSFYSFCHGEQIIPKLWNTSSQMNLNKDYFNPVKDPDNVN